MRPFICASLAIALAGCARDNSSSHAGASATASSTFTDSAARAPAVTAAAQAIDTAALLQHIKDLAADSMEGRAPGTPGEEKAVAYLTQQFHHFLHVLYHNICMLEEFRQSICMLDNNR